MASSFSSDQIAEYLTFVQLPPQWHPSAKPKLDLNYLTILHVHQISTIPYENLSLHYSKDKDINLDPQHLFHKFLVRKRGGYCLENSIFYNHVLRALGFQVYTAGVRIRLRKDGVPFGRFEGWRHVVNIVTLADPTNPTKQIKYMVDVGFGGDGATKPLALLHDNPQHNLGTQTIRLIYDTIPDQIDRSPSQRLWIYQYRNGDDREWNTYYAFPEVEFTEIDLATLNFWLVRHEGSFQRFMVLIIKFIRGEKRAQTGSVVKTDTDGDVAPGESGGDDSKVTREDRIDQNPGTQTIHREQEEITGKLMLVDNKIKRNLGGKTEVVDEMKTEAERVAAIKKWFGIDLTDEEVSSIRGHWTEIVSE